MICMVDQKPNTDRAAWIAFVSGNDCCKLSAQEHILRSRHADALMG